MLFASIHVADYVSYWDTLRKETGSLSRDLLPRAVNYVPLILNVAEKVFLGFQVFSGLDYLPLDNELSWGGELNLNVHSCLMHTYAHRPKGTVYSILVYQ